LILNNISYFGEVILLGICSNTVGNATISRPSFGIPVVVLTHPVQNFACNSEHFFHLYGRSVRDGMMDNLG